MNISDIATAIEEIEEDKALELVNEAIAAELDATEVLQKGVLAGLKMIGKRFETKEYFLAELLLGAKLAEQCIAILDPHLPKGTGPKRGTVVIGAVQGDTHDIGYGIVAKQLELAGYQVQTLGVNVPSMTFIDKARETKADIIGLSAFLVTTAPNCVEVINYLRDMGLREQFKVIIGGAQTSDAAAEDMGADGWAPNAVEAVRLCDSLLGYDVDD